MFILDCVRATELPGGGRPVPGLRFLNDLYSRSTAYPRSIAAAPWTLPSHESLLTGRYPWEARPLTEVGGWSLPMALREQGYRTLLLSANPLLSELRGIGAHFDEVYVSHWWEPFFRPGLPIGPVRVNPDYVQQRTGPFAPLRGALTVLPLLLTRFPRTLARLSTWAQHLRRGGGRPELNTAPWLEGTLASWLASVPDSTPVCCVINLSEAHEPYLQPDIVSPDGGREGGAGVRQDSVGWLMGSWDPTSGEATALESMYRRAVAGLDSRVEGLARLLAEANRWEGAVVTVTSDHGQAFGEHGMFFHGHRVDEALVRVPLWVKLPGGESLPSDSREWTSHVDVPGTLYSEATGHTPPRTSGISLRSLVSRHRGAPVYAESTGIQLERAHLVSPERRTLLHCHRMAGYSGSRKAVVESPSGKVLVYDIDRDPNELVTLWPSADWETRSLVESVRSAMCSADQTVELEPPIDRLVSWGYA